MSRILHKFVPTGTVSKTTGTVSKWDPHGPNRGPGLLLRTLAKFMKNFPDWAWRTYAQDLRKLSDEVQKEQDKVKKGQLTLTLTRHKEFICSVKRHVSAVSRGQLEDDWRRVIMDALGTTMGAYPDCPN